MSVAEAGAKHDKAVLRIEGDRDHEAHRSYKCHEPVRRWETAKRIVSAPR